MAAEALGALLNLGGSGLDAWSSWQGGEATADALRKQARDARGQGREALRQADYRVRMIHEAGAELLGEISAETGKSGLAMTGTPLATLVTNARRVELSAALETRAGRVEYQRWQAQSQTLLEEAENAEDAGKFGAFGSILKVFG
jgi:hypothetical protein